jgi:cytochrome c-type biogenesis protein CcmH
VRPRLRSLIVALAASALLAISAAPAAAAEQASLPDIEDEVMCPICGTILEASNSPQAEREREFIRAQIAQGKKKGGAGKHEVCSRLQLGF